MALSPRCGAVIADAIMDGIFSYNINMLSPRRVIQAKKKPGLLRALPYQPL
jgi:hypothetical protein